MASRKRKGAKAGAKDAKGAARVGAWAAPKARRIARKTAWKAGKAEVKLVRHALSSKEPRSVRFLKYGFFALVGLAIGALISRSGRKDSSSSFTDTTVHHTSDAGSPAGQRGQTWGSGTPTGTAVGATAGQSDVSTAPGEHQRPEDENRTGTERSNSDPTPGSA
jgi:hypothetical protein